MTQPYASALEDILTDDLRDKLYQTETGKKLWEIFSNNQLTTYFQPIIDYKHRSILGYEALTRGPENTPYYSPLMLLEQSSELNCLFEFDLLARLLAILRYQEFSKTMSKQSLLFLNISVNSLMHGHHRSGMTLEYVNNLDLAVDNVVIEITEHQPVHNYLDFLEALNHYRQMGFKIAIDDLGGGYNTLRIWAEVHPEFVKVDKYFTSDIHKSREKTKFMETIVNLASSFGTRVISEGVETEKELAALERIGVDYVQGFLFKKPQPKLVEKLDFKWKSHKDNSETVETVELLVESIDTISSHLTVNEVSDILHRHPEWEYVPVVDDGIVYGMVWRRELMDLLARRYLPELLQRKTVFKVMDQRPIVIDAYTPLVELSRRITNDTDKKVSQAFIVTKNGKYHGCGTFSGILKIMTDLKVKNAQYANPLSALPGNVPIQNTLRSYLEEDQEFVVMYIDVNHFKPYNDYYSFEQGDGVITTIANILKSVSYSDEIFVGHVGGDDFVMIFPDYIEYEELCHAVLDQFAKNITLFYNREDAERGGILAKNRQNEEQFFEMMTLSIGVLVACPSQFQHTQQLSTFATRAKKLAKGQGGNSFAVINTRKEALEG